MYVLLTLQSMMAWPILDRKLTPAVSPEMSTHTERPWSSRISGEHRSRATVNTVRMSGEHGSRATVNIDRKSGEHRAE